MKVDKVRLGLVQYANKGLVWFGRLIKVASYRAMSVENIFFHEFFIINYMFH